MFPRTAELHISAPRVIRAVILALAVFASFSQHARAQEDTAHVEIGMFVASVFDLDFYNGTYKTIFWVWFIHDDPDYDPLEAIEITNARQYEVMESYGYTRADGRFYVAAKLRATINQPWDIADFPFDTQRLDIVLESVGKDSNELTFDVDRANSVNGPELHLDGWNLRPVQATTTVFQYNTTFGEESGNLLSFPRVQFYISMERDNPKLFFEAYIGYMIAFLMCAVIWLTRTMNMPDYRIGMILAATFVTIGNKNTLESNYPPSPRLGLADQIEAATFILIVCSMVIAVGAERLAISGRPQLAEKINRFGMPLILVIYLAQITHFVMLAHS
ncbi:MAG: hypothetical protein RIM33_17625 [Alphaproteobacteria bacterium]